MKVSVILPCKNAERTVRAAVKSVLEQSLDDLEILVIDESSDRSLSVIRSFDDSRIRVYHSPRLGLATSQNLGIVHSRGEYIARMDADDVCLPDRLSIEAGYLDKHPSVGMVAGQAFFRQGEKLYPSPLAHRFSSPVSLNHLLLRVNPIVASASMIRRSTVMEVGGYDLSFDRWPYAEDYDLAIRIARISKVMLIPDYVCIYTMSATSMSTRRSIDRLIGLCISKVRSASLAESPIDLARIAISIVRSVGMDLASRVTKDRLFSYILNMHTLESRL